MTSINAAVQLDTLELPVMVTVLAVVSHTDSVLYFTLIFPHHIGTRVNHTVHIPGYTVTRRCSVESS